MSRPSAGLVVEDLAVRYGGLHAVRGLSLHAPPQRITALIGPNGAGKTTTFNALGGLVRASSGTVELFGADITGLSPPARAQRGLGRTFQRMELFDSLTVAENVALGREARMAGRRPIRHLVAHRDDARVLGEAVGEALQVCGLEALAGQRAGRLSTGQRRLVELARVLGGDFRVLLLDEPSSGLDAGETRRFGEILREVVRRRGVGILLVEHDMSLVMEICDYVYVIDFGEPLFAGAPDEVRASPEVRAAYLGVA